MVQSNEDIKKALHGLPQVFESLSSGQKSKLRRARRPEELESISGFYVLLSNHPILQNSFWKMKNVVFFIPWIEHTEGISLGGSFSRAGIEEGLRIYQVMRSSYPNDLFYLMRLTKMAISKGNTKKLKVDWQKMSNILFYWGDDSKRRILREFFEEEHFTKNKPEEKENIHDDE